MNKNRLNNRSVGFLAGSLILASFNLNAVEWDIKDSTGDAMFGGAIGQGSQTEPIKLNGDSHLGSTRMFWFPYKAAFRVGGLSDSEGYFECGGNGDIYADLPYYWDADHIGKYSIAVGLNTLAKGDHSIAMGEMTRAIGDNSISFGMFNHATGSSSVAIGYGNEPAGTLSTAIGTGNNAEGIYSMALGFNNESVGYGSTALGFWNHSLAVYSVAIGYQSKAQIGMGAIAIGYFAEAKGFASLATGDHTHADGAYSFTSGKNTQADTEASSAHGFETEAGHVGTFVVGVKNNPLTTSIPYIYDTDRPLFIVGNGDYFSSEQSNALVVFANGYTELKVEPKGGIGMGNFSSN